MDDTWIDAGPADALPEGEPTLLQLEEQRLVGVRVGDEVHVMDDLCPHQGYPLSQGAVRGCVLTCEWHNWKFDLRTGACTTGGDAVRRYPTRVHEGRVYVCLAADREEDARRYEAGLAEALREGDTARATREALRLADARARSDLAGLGPSFEVLVVDAARRGRWGFGHDLAQTADLCAWVERELVDGVEAFVLAAAAVGLTSANLPLRPEARAEGPVLRFPAADALLAALGEERRGEAELRARYWTEVYGARRTIEEALLPFLAEHLYDYGHGLIFAHKALELCERFPAAAEEVVASLTVSLSWATAETALPPFTATRRALEEVRASPPGGTPDGTLDGAPAPDREAYEAAVLASEREGVGETLRLLRAGADAPSLLTAIGHAAAERLVRFDASWERRLDAEVGILDVTHAVTFAEAAAAFAERAPCAVGWALALQAAGFVGKLRRADRPLTTPGGLAGSDEPTTVAELVEAVERRDLDDATRRARALDPRERPRAFAALSPFAALDAAATPIRYAHTIKTTEALRRLDDADPRADDTYLMALVTYLAPRRPETNPRRTAAIAREFMAHGRPPKGLY